jgi:transposase
MTDPIFGQLAIVNKQAKDDSTILRLSLDAKATDNGPENHSRRTQFMKRIVEFAQRHCINIRLAYYPPYHSKYNPIERTWGILENHWNGSILDEIDTVLNFARTMT